MGPVFERLFSISKMRAFAFVLLSLAAVKADSDPYTIGQVASGFTRGGVITGVDYSNGVVSGYGAIGNRGVAYANHAYSAPVAASYAICPCRCPRPCYLYYPCLCYPYLL